MQHKKIDKTKIILIAVVVLFVLLLIISVIAKLSPKEKKKAASGVDYKLITDVPGCEFEINKKNSDLATAVTEISKSINFLDYETYSFKNGQDLYIIFNMNRYITIVKKGTNFHLSETDLDEALAQSNLQGIWFTPLPKEKVSKSGNKYSVLVKGEVVITNNLYNDFTGILTTIEKDGEEWSMFSGYINTEDMDMVAMSEYVTDSFVTAEEYQVVQADFTVDIETDQVLTINDEEVDTPIVASQETIKEVTETPKEPEQTPEPDESEETTKQEEAAADSLTASQKEREIVNDETTAYSSTKYSMLPIESIGYMDILNEDIGKMEPAYIRITDVLSEDETVNLLKDNPELSSIEIPDNCHIESAYYDVRYTSQTKSYIDIRLAGIDGDVYRFRGVEYSNKTYDIETTVTEENDWNCGNLIVYVVPNGSYDYAFKCTGIINNDDNRPAWFKVCTKK